MLLDWDEKNRNNLLRLRLLSDSYRIINIRILIRTYTKNFRIFPVSKLFFNYSTNMAIEYIHRGKNFEIYLK